MSDYNLTKDFTRPEFANPVMDFWEFFADNPHYSLIKYEPIKDGIRAYYVVVQ